MKSKHPRFYLGCFCLKVDEVETCGRASAGTESRAERAKTLAERDCDRKCLFLDLWC
jgi:hypothetical protein